MPGAESELRQRNVNNLQVSRVVVPTAEGKKRDEQLDKHTESVSSPPRLPPRTLTSRPGMSSVDHGVLWPS